MYSDYISEPDRIWEDIGLYARESKKKGDREERETRNCVAYDNIIIISLIGT